MTFHSRSIIAFGQFFNKISDSVLKGVPLKASLELIREQFAANAVVLAVENRNRPTDGAYIVATANESADSDHNAPALSRSAQARELSGFVGTCHQVNASQFGADETTCYTLTIFRPLADPAFDQEEQSICEILVSQLSRSLEMAWRMDTTEVERTLYSDVMDRLYVGVIILDRSGKVVRMSSTANRILTERDSLNVQGGRLRATCSNEDRELQAVIKSTLQGMVDNTAPATRGLSLTKQSGSKNLGLIIRPIEAHARHAVAANSAVAVYLRDPEAIPEIEGELVRQLFDLTPAEAAVARRLTVGLSLDEAASSLDISRNTARAHLRSIFSKSGITRQTELVRLVLNSVVLLGERPHQAA